MTYQCMQQIGLYNLSDLTFVFAAIAVATDADPDTLVPRLKD